MGDRQTELRYEAGTASLGELEAALQQFFTVLDTDRQVREDAEDAGVDIEVLKEVGPAGIALRVEGAGADAATLIIVGITVKLVDTAFDEVILPWIKRQLGRGAVGQKDA